VSACRSFPRMLSLPPCDRAASLLLTAQNQPVTSPTARRLQRRENGVPLGAPRHGAHAGLQSPARSSFHGTLTAGGNGRAGANPAATLRLDFQGLNDLGLSAPFPDNATARRLPVDRKQKNG